ncbi:MAG: peptide chain release factor N(5)-glutamine methyltransferase [Paludibacteraceae bacterium]|nr:peptide chain release factor N(5)-glutamine methyltransferase [Paludibacteraceae bacterium]
MKELINYISSRLADLYGNDESLALAWWILEELTGCTRSQLQFGYKGTKNIPNYQTIDKIIVRLRQNEPVQYIFGHTLWCGLDLRVSPATLIPRPETAELVETISNCFKQPQTTLDYPVRVLDIGTGSGCIAIALKKLHPEWQVTGMDISADAVAVARENARRNNVEVSFLQADIFSDETEETFAFRLSPFTLIVSNPPYICESEKSTMRRNVLDYEPSSALFVPDDDPLLFYRRIVQLFCRSSIRPSVHSPARNFFFEINEAYGNEVQKLMREHGCTDIQLIHDIYGKPRIIQGRMAWQSRGLLCPRRALRGRRPSQTV